MTISGEAMGRKTSRFIEERPANWWRTRAKAARVPMMVAPRVARNPISIERTRASHMDGSSQMLSQLCRVNPSKLVDQPASRGR